MSTFPISNRTIRDRNSYGFGILLTKKRILGNFEIKSKEISKINEICEASLFIGSNLQVSFCILLKIMHRKL